MALSDAGARRIRIILRDKREDPERFFGNQPKQLELERLEAERDGRARPKFLEAKDEAEAGGGLRAVYAGGYPSGEAALAALHRQQERDLAMSTVIKRGRTGGQRVALYKPTKPVSTPRAESHRALRTAQAAQGTNAPYYSHLNEARDQQDNKTRSTAMPPVNRSDAGAEGVGRSPAQGKVFNDEDEGRHQTTVTPDERAKLLAEKEGIEQDMKLRGKSYFRDERKQKRYRDIVDKLGVPA